MLRHSKQSLKSASRLRAVSTRMGTTACKRTLTYAAAQIKSSPLSATGRPMIQRPPMFNLMQTRGYAEVVNVPDMAESITEGTLKSFEKEVGDHVGQDEEVATIETDKIDVSVNAPMAGTITEFLANPEDTVEVGQPLLKIEPGEAPAGGAAKKEEPKQESKKEEPKKEEPKKEEPKKEEPKKEEPAPQPKQEESKPQPKQESKPEPKKESKPGSSKESSGSSSSGPAPGNREERRVKMNRMRLRIAERLKESQNTAASLTTFQEVDMSSLMEMRKLYKDEILKKTGTKFGFMGAFAKASVLAMKDVPAVNAAIEGPNGGDTIVYRDYVDISVAVATSKGLVTPVVRNAESLEVVGIEQEINELGLKARDNKLTLEDMSGGTFTISNGGVFGSLYGTPIINMPQCAVLGLHGVKERAVVVNGQVVARPMMYLALTYDHRLLDGREAVTFLKTVKELIEDPRKMLLM